MNDTQLQSILDSVDDMIVVIDAAYNVTACNRKAAETLLNEGATGTSIATALKDPSIYEKIMNSLQAILAGQQPNFSEQTMAVSDSVTVFLKIEGYPLVEDNAITGVTLVFSDMFYEKELQEQLLQTEELFTFKEVLLGAANELNNLLTIIASYGTLMQARPNIDQQIFEDVTKVTEQTHRAKGIVANLLQLAKKHEAKSGKLDVNAVIQKVFEMRQYELTVNNLLVEFDLNEVPMTVGDSYRMQQLILNLLNHCMDAIIQSGLAGTIKISSTVEDGSIKLSFSDNGPRFTDEQLPVVFNAFSSATPGERKISMGLSICRRIVSEHNGQIGLKNLTPRGVEFEIFLPVVDPSQFEGSDVRKEALEGQAGARSKYKKIMVVDDEEGIRTVLCQLLEALGYTVASSADGRMALSQIIKENPDAIISDMRMPHVNGKTLYKAVQKMNPKLAANMMFITGDVVRQDSSSFLGENNLPYLNKPFTLADIERSLDHLASTEDQRVNRVLA